jgi:hypothetical protein
MVDRRMRPVFSMLKVSVRVFVPKFFGMPPGAASGK